VVIDDVHRSPTLSAPDFGDLLDLKYEHVFAQLFAKKSQIKIELEHQQGKLPNGDAKRVTEPVDHWKVEARNEWADRGRSW
jgi:hypothetical protein